jgi:hypothetical protein
LYTELGLHYFVHFIYCRYSLDKGVSWTGIAAVANMFSIGRGVLFGTNVWIAFGGGSGIQSAWSPDGVLWNTSSSANLFPTAAFGGTGLG